MPRWAWRIVFVHLLGKKSRVAVKWMNCFALIGLSMGFFSWVSVMSIMDGFQLEQKNNRLAVESHFLWEGKPQEGLLGLAESLEDSVPEVKSVRVILSSEALMEIRNLGQKSRISGSGVVLMGDPDVPKGRAVLGLELASLKRIFDGDLLSLRSVWRPEGQPLELQSEGIFQTGVISADRSQVRVNDKQLGQWLGLEKKFSRLELRLHDPLRVDSLAPMIARHTEPYGITLRSWKEVNEALWYSLKLEKNVLFFSIFFVILLASLAIYFVLTVRVSEKSREIGLLMAIGATKKVVSRIFLMEGLMIGACGSLIGLFMAWIFCRYFIVGIEMPDFYYSTHVPVEWSWSRNLTMLLMSLTMCLFLSWSPSRRVLSFEPSQALRS